jgi:hypothetical protein
MNKTIASAALGFLALGSLSTGLTSKVNALTTPTVLPIETSTTVPQPVTVSDSTQEIAYQVNCATDWINGRRVTCCADSTGEWACVW